MNDNEHPRIPYAGAALFARSLQLLRNWRYVVDFLRTYVPGLAYVVTRKDVLGDEATMWGGYALWEPDDTPKPVNTG